MASIQDLIDQLNQIDDKNQSIMFQYYLAEHFEFSDGTPSPTAEQFDQAVDDLDDESLWDDAHETINDYLYGICESDNEQEENE